MMRRGRNETLVLLGQWDLALDVEVEPAVSIAERLLRQGRRGGGRKDEP